jgi:hypothetical protein
MAMVAGREEMDRDFMLMFRYVLSEVNTKVRWSNEIY